MIVYEQGIARTQSPTTRNCAPELPTFGAIAGFSPTGVQWKGLDLGDPPSWSRIPLSQVSMIITRAVSYSIKWLLRSTRGHYEILTSGHNQSIDVDHESDYSWGSFRNYRIFPNRYWQNLWTSFNPPCYFDVETVHINIYKKSEIENSTKHVSGKEGNMNRAEDTHRLIIAASKISTLITSSIQLSERNTDLVNKVRKISTL